MPNINPKMIDGHPIERKLGEGAAGAVYLVRLPGKQRFAALKILKGRPDPGVILRFRREFGAIARLQHPGIITVYAFGEFENSPYYLMEYARGTDFRSFLRQGVRDRSMLPQNQNTLFINLTVQILDALRYLHSEQIVHQDLKPANILITEEAKVKLLDFGLAQTRYLMSEQRSTGGTAGYLSPEQLLGRPVDPRSDLYSLGICLYEVLCGVHPFGMVDDWHQLVSRQLAGQVIRPTQIHPQIDPAWDTILLRLMAADPSDRFQTAEQTLSAIRPLGTLELQADVEIPYGSFGLLPSRWIDPLGIVPKCLAAIKQGESFIVYNAAHRAGRSRFLEEIKNAVTPDYPAIIIDMDDEKDEISFFMKLCHSMSQILKSDFQKDPVLKKLKEFLEMTPSSESNRSPQQRRLDFIQGLNRIGELLKNSGKLILLLDNLCAYNEFFKEAFHSFMEGDRSGFCVIAAGLPGDYYHSLCPLVLESAPWTDAEVSLYVSSVLGITKLHKEVALKFTSIGEGKPGILLDILNGWIMEKSLVYKLGEWFICPPAVNDITALDTLSDIRRLNPPKSFRPQLPVGDRIDREILRSLSVYGREIPFSVLKATFTARDELILEILDRLIRMGWINEVIQSDETYYRFNRDDYTEYMYDSISPFHLSILHRKFADIVAKKEGYLKDRADFLADQYNLSDDPSLAIPYAEQATQLAQSRFDHQRALYYLEMIQNISASLANCRRHALAGPTDFAPRFDSLSATSLDAEFINAQEVKTQHFNSLWMSATRERGQIFSLKGDYGLAFEEFQRMLARAKDRGSSSHEAEALRFIGQVLFYQKKFEESAKYFNDSLVIRRELDDVQGIADCLNALGAIAQQQNRLDQAKDYFLDALAAKQQLKDEKGVAYLLNNLGNIAYLKKDYPQAIQYFTQSYTYLEKTASKLGMAYSQFNLGETYRALSKWDLAVKAVKIALRLRKEMEDIRGVALCYRELGEIAIDRGDRDSGVQNLLKAAAIYEDLGCQDDATLCRNLTNCSK